MKQQQARAAQFPVDSAARVAAIAKNADTMVDRYNMSGGFQPVEAISSGALRIGAGLGDSLTAFANNLNGNPTLQTATESIPVVGSAMRMANLLLNKDQNGNYVQPNWTAHLRAVADDIQPGLMNVHFSDALKAGQGTNWVLTQTAAQVPMVAMTVAGIVQPELMPAVLASMGASGAGEQYDADIKRGVDPQSAARDAAINGGLQVGAGALSMGIAKLATPAFMAFTRTLGADASQALSQRILKTAVAELAAGTVGAGADIAGQVGAKALMNLSEQQVAGLPTKLDDGLLDTAMSMIIPSIGFYASGRIPHIAANARDTLAETVIDRALARAAQPDQTLQNRADIIRDAAQSAAQISPTFTNRKMVQLVQAKQNEDENQREPDAATLPDQQVAPPPAEEDDAGLLQKFDDQTGNRAGDDRVSSPNAADTGIDASGQPAVPAGEPGTAATETPEEAAVRSALNDRLAGIGGDSSLSAGDVKIVERPTGVQNALAEAVKSVTGTDVRFVDDPEGKLDLDGAVVPGISRRTLYLNTQSTTPLLFVAGHETVHSLFAAHPDIYARLLNVMREEGINLPDAAGFHFRDDPTVAQLDRGPTPEGHERGSLAEEEAISDYVGRRWMDPTFWEGLSKKDPTLFQRMITVAREFLGRLSDAFRSSGVPNSDWINDTERARQAVEDAYREWALRENPKYAAAKALERSREPPTGGDDIAKLAKKRLPFHDTQHITGEMLPTTTSDYGKRVMGMSPTNKVLFTRAIQKEVPLSHLAEAFGIPHHDLSYTYGSGGYEGNTSPNLVVQLKSTTPIDKVRQLAKAMMYVYHQDAVPFFRASPDLDPNKSHLGVRVEFAKPLTDTREREMFKVMRDTFGPDAGYTKVAPNEIVRVNYYGENNDVFAKQHEQFLQAMAAAGNKPTLSEHFGVESEYPFHDWTQDPAGRQLVGADSGRTADQSDLQARLDSWRQRVQQAGDAFANRQTDQQGGADDRAVSGDAGTPAAQATAAVEAAKASIKREVATPEFKRWFRQSDIKNEDGTPKMMYHGTARDIREFRGKQAGAIFVTSDPEFADAFTSMSKDWMYKNADQILTKEQLDAAEKAAEERLAANKPADDEWTPDEAWRIVNEEREKYFPSNENIMPVFVRAEKPFDYENKAQIDAITKAVFDDPALQHRVDAGEDKVYLGGPASNDPSGMRHLSPYSKADFKHLLSEGYWDVIEHSVVQRALKAQGYDGFYVREAGRKNLAVYDPNQLKSAVGNTGEYSLTSNDITLRRKNPKTQSPMFTHADAGKYELPEQTKAQKAIQKFVDRFERVLRIQDVIRQQGGDVNDMNNIYYALERMPGRTDARVAEFMDETLEPIIKDAAKAKVDLKDAMMLAYAEHAEERNKQIAKINPEQPDGGSGMSTERAQQVIADFAARPNADAIREIAHRFQAITGETANILKREGIITPEAAENWEKASQRYVPLRGNETTADDHDIYGSGKMIDQRGDVIPRALGRYTEAEPKQIFGNIVQDRIAAVVRSEKNKIGKTLLRFVLDNPDKNLWSVDEIKKTRSIVTNAAGQQEVVEHANINRDPENSIITKVGGREFAITIKDPTLAAQLTGMNKENMDVLTKSMGTVSRAFVKLWTQWNPVFVGTNFFRDVQTALAHSWAQYGTKRVFTVLKYMPSAMRAMWQYENGKRVGNSMLGYTHDFVMNGGKVGTVSLLGLGERIDQINRLYSSADNAVWKQPQKAASFLLDVISMANHTAENAVRVATYRAAIESGASTVEATHQAKTIRVNFNRKGDYTPMANSLFLFFNPAIQESSRIIGAIKRNPKAMGAIVSMQVATGFVAAYLSSQDKDEDGVAYWDKPEYDQRKQRNLVFIIPGTGGKAVMMPLPYGYNAFYNLGYALNDKLRGAKSDAQIAKDVGFGFWEGFSPMGGNVAQAGPGAFIPTVWQPFSFTLANRDEFGSKIVPGEDTSPNSQRYKVGTRGTPQQLFTEWLNSKTGGDAYISGHADVSPELVNYLTKYATGGLGTFLYDGLSTAFQAMMGGADNADLQRLPFIRQFAVLEHQPKRDAGLYYDRMAQLKTAVADYNDALKKQDEDRTLALQDRFGEDMLVNVGSAMHGFQSMLKDLRTQELAIHDSDDPYGSKQVQLKEIDEKRGEVYMEFNKLFTAANQGKLSLDLPGK